ncbi:hypothetical protein [Palleronia sp.]|uniref:hypothetical protein n=1 Tax=Palleronia sp. TaxID=1940284 RepID=UPI0035C798EC
MTANLIALLSSAFAGVFGDAWLRRRNPSAPDFPTRVVEAISGRPGGALVLVEGAGLDPAALSGDLLGPRDEVLAGDGRFAVRLDAPGRDAEFARWLCRAQVALEERGGTVRMGATRTGPDAWPEDHLARAERALARATSDETAVAIDDHAPRAVAFDTAVITFTEMPILCAERGRLVAVEPVAPPELERCPAASPEEARRLFLARLKSGARMLGRHGDAARLSLPLSDDLAGDPDLHVALVFALDGCELEPERVTLRIGAGLPATSEKALAATGCTISTAAPTACAVGVGPHWLPPTLVRDMDSDETARSRVAAILAQATETGAEVLAGDVASPETAHMLVTLGCTLVAGPGVPPPSSEHPIAPAKGEEDHPGSASGG